MQLRAESRGRARGGTQPANKGQKGQAKEGRRPPEAEQPRTRLAREVESQLCNCVDLHSANCLNEPGSGFHLGLQKRDQADRCRDFSLVGPIEITEL